MQKSELGHRAVDLALGKRVEGAVAAVLRNPDSVSHRYIVRTGDNHLDTRVQSYFRLSALVPIYLLRQSLQCGDVFDARTLSTKTWTDRQKI